MTDIFDPYESLEHSLTDSFDSYESSLSNSTLLKLAIVNENLCQINDNLHAKVSTAEDHVASLKDKIRDLERN